MAGSVEAPDQFSSGLLLEFDPNTVRTPVAASLMFAPPILVFVGPLPIVAINVESEFGLVVVFLLARRNDSGGLKYRGTRRVDPKRLRLPD